MRLRGCLIVSFMAVLGVTLAVMTVALVVFLFAQPVPAAQSYERLSVTLGDILAESGLADGRLTIGETRALLGNLPAIASRHDVRVMVLNLQRKIMLLDTAGAFSAGQAIAIDPETFTLPLYLGRSLLLRGEPVFGRFQDADGATWLFAGLTGVRDGTETNALILAEPQPRQTVQAVLQRLRQELGPPLCQSTLIGLLAALALAAFISRRIAGPLSALAAAAGAVAKGQFDRKAPEEGPLEVREAAAAFNQMSAEVLAARQAQRDFVINVSHDLKTPLTSIQGFSQAIMDGAAKDPTGAAKVIHEEAGRLNRMVTELTDLARLEAGRLSMKTGAVDMGQLAAAVGERLAVLARQKNLTLHLQTAPTPTITGDGDRLAQVLTNLVSNAIKYTPAGGQIWLTTRAAQDGVEVTVRDTGIGIPSDELPRVFERFYQVDKARGPRRGTGLGLAITQEIVEAHGGRISVTSAGEGKGSTFMVWLPSPGPTAIVRGRMNPRTGDKTSAS